MQRFGRVELEWTRRKGAAWRSHMLGNLIFEHHTDYSCYTLKELDDAPLP
ncbi:hypothetical protein ACRRTK_020303 [Alexandromys fortis]